MQQKDTDCLAVRGEKRSVRNSPVQSTKVREDEMLQAPGQRLIHSPWASMVDEVNSLVGCQTYPQLLSLLDRMGEKYQDVVSCWSR